MIQFTPPGSPASVIFGSNVTAAAPGSAQGLYLTVSDIETANRLAHVVLGRSFDSGSPNPRTKLSAGRATRASPMRAI